MYRKIDLAGQRIGRLLVIEETTKDKYSHTRWLCKCDCGNTTLFTTSDLCRGKVKSCGCYRNERIGESNRTHGASRTRLYDVWLTMIARCNKPNSTAYKNYGGRGIKVCDEWLKDFASFKEWAGKSGYRENLTIERKDVNGNYSPDNCTWITRADQQKNTRRTHRVVYQGKEMPLLDLSKLMGISPTTIKKYEKQCNYNYDLLVTVISEKPHHKSAKRRK